MLLSVEFHILSSPPKSVFAKHEHTKGTLWEGASMSINRVEKDAADRASHPKR